MSLSVRFSTPNQARSLTRAHPACGLLSIVLAALVVAYPKLQLEDKFAAVLLATRPQVAPLNLGSLDNFVYVNAGVRRLSVPEWAGDGGQAPAMAGGYNETAMKPS